MESTKNVVIIILNWNGWQDTIECLESIYQNDYSNYKVIVVDNDSNDESINKIKEYCNGKIKIKSSFFRYNPSNKPIKVLETESNEHFKENIIKSSSRKLILIKNDKNAGYAEGNNIGIRYALNYLNSDYIYF